MAAVRGDVPHQRPWEEVVGDLEVDPDHGLTESEARRRLERDGPNELRSAPPVPLWRRILAQFRDPLVILLLVAIVISVAAWVVEGAAGVPVDAIVIAVIVLLNAAIGFVEEARAEDAVAALASMTAANSTVVREGRLVTIPSADLVIGDVLVLAEGDAIGADARILAATGLKVQEASLTGESEATEKSAAALAADTALGDRRNMVHKGTAVVQGVGRAVVTATGMETEMGAIAGLLESTESEPTPLQREIAAVSRSLGIIVVVIAVVVMAAVALLNGVSTAEEAVTVLLLGVSLAVAAVPEGLPAILSLVLAIGVRVLARRNAVMKSLHSVETLGSASVICSDKTGTLTRNEMTLRTVVTPLGRVDLDGIGYRPEGSANVADADDPRAAERAASRVLVTGALANNAQLTHDADDGWSIEGDPTEAAFLVAVRKVDGAHERLELYDREGEIPFDSQRKRMSTQVTHRNGHRRLFTKGAPDVLLERCTHVLVGDDVRALDADGRARVLADVEELSGQAFRTLAVAYRDLADDELTEAGELDESAERDLVHLGVVGIMDPPREEVADAIADAHRAGIRTVMITGDHPATALRIATDLGIVVGPGATARTGTELDGLTDEEFAAAVRETSVFARVAPAHKLRIVDALQADRHVVAMTGDGVNDAPALKSADIGIAMGITGTEVTKEAATMILGDDNYATIVRAVRQGRVIFDNITKFLRYLLSSNMGEVATVFLGVVLASVIGLTDGGTGGLVVPLLATQILWINLVTDSGPALAMGMDPEIDDVMGRAPRSPDDRILDREMWGRILSIGLVMAAVTLLTIDIALPAGLVEGQASFVEGRTAGFTALVFAQLFNALNARSATTSAFHGLLSNRWLVGALVLGAVLQVAVVELPFLQVAFGTTSMGLELWLIAIAMSSVVLWFEEAAKVVRRRGHLTP